MSQDRFADASRISFSVSTPVAWAPGVETADDWQAWARGERPIGTEGAPAIKHVPAMLRRHAGQLGRMVCEVAFRALDGARDVPTVFCSHHGETTRSVDMLTDLARGMPLSPTAFSLSVHNSAPGLVAIARHDTANSTSLAAGEDSAALGVIEACGFLADGAPRVLLVVADSPLPDVYRSFDDMEPMAFAWAAILTPAADRRITLEWRDSDDRHARLRVPAALEMLRFFQGDARELVQRVETHEWRWTRSD